MHAHYLPTTVTVLLLWWWQVFRKYLLTSVVLVVEHDTNVQIYFGQLVCVVSVLLVARHQPYKARACLLLSKSSLGD